MKIYSANYRCNSSLLTVEFPECNLLYKNCWIGNSLFRRKVWLQMKSISSLIEVSAKKKPLQKISAYKSLTKNYLKLRKLKNEQK